MSQKAFYKNLRIVQLPLTNVFKSANFIDVPAEWYIVIADVKNSTGAVAAGNHNDVNLIAAGTLIAALNIARRYDIEIPFFFGGDGGTLIVPEEIVDDVIAALRIHNQNSIKNFNLELHVGKIRVKQIMEAGHILKIAKVQFGKDFNKAVVVGNGLNFAEHLVKQDIPFDEGNAEAELNLTGLECRWDRIKPPSNANEIVCYIIEAVNPNEQIEIYREVLNKIDNIYGDIEMRNPLSPDRLKLLISFDKVKKEAMAKHGKMKIGYIASALLKTFIGKLYFRYNLKVRNLRGKEYLNQLIKNADTLTIDGRINTIITGQMNKRIELVNYLTEQQKAGRLIFGHYISTESVMTCYIENRNSKHIHFVDGGNGGYTQASKQFKKQVAELQR